MRPPGRRTILYLIRLRCSGPSTRIRQKYDGITTADILWLDDDENRRPLADNAAMRCRARTHSLSGVPPIASNPRGFGIRGRAIKQKRGATRKNLRRRALDICRLAAGAWPLPTGNEVDPANGVECLNRLYCRRVPRTDRWRLLPSLSCRGRCACLYGGMALSQSPYADQARRCTRSSRRPGSRPPAKSCQGHLLHGRIRIERKRRAAVAGPGFLPRSVSGSRPLQSRHA